MDVWWGEGLERVWMVSVRGLTLDMFSWCKDRRSGLLLYALLRVYTWDAPLRGIISAHAMATVVDVRVFAG